MLNMVSLCYVMMCSFVLYIAHILFTFVIMHFLYVPVHMV
jgi:hypothetical protein